MSLTNLGLRNGASQSGIAQDYEAINLASTDYTPRDLSGNLVVCRGIYVGVTGNVTLVSPEGNTVTFPNVPVGDHGWSFVKVIKATTTASGLIALV